MNVAADKDCYDVAIAGGGLIGASLACALAPLGLRTVVIESVSRELPDQPSFDDRTLALSRSSCRILEGIGVWAVLRDDATPIRRIIVTELGRPGRVVLDPAELGLREFGHVVEARRFGAAVQRRMSEQADIELRCPVTVRGIQRDTGHVTIETEGEDGGDRVRARLLVAADGACSTVRRLLSIDVEERNYRQTAVICNFEPELHHEGRAFECFTRTGPFAVLPHADNRCGLVWSVSSDEAERLLSLPEDEYLLAARRRFGPELGDFVRMGRRSAYPLKLVRARRDTDERVVILGNAAHAIHPVGAQGFNLGCRDVAVLAELLAGLGAGDPGSARVLEKYSAWRRPDHEETIRLSDGLVRVFANPTPLASALRRAGFLAHALLPVLRRRLSVGAMGYRGRIPRLAQGLPLHGASP
jgi:2-octaprenyl-6-methoxyphenol hydroxylase